MPGGDCFSFCARAWSAAILTVESVLLVVVIVMLGAGFFTGLSMIIAAIVKTRERFMGIGQVITLPLFFASSAMPPSFT